MRLGSGDIKIELLLSENNTIEVVMNTAIPTASGSEFSLNHFEIFFPRINQLTINKINEKPVVSASGRSIDLNNKKSDFSDVRPIIMSINPATRLIVIPIVIIALVDNLLLSIFVYY
ncbi:MAG: hypothetical protein WBB48_03205 [Thermodesulfobacteriota bacterium]